MNRAEFEVDLIREGYEVREGQVIEADVLVAKWYYESSAVLIAILHLKSIASPLTKARVFWRDKKPTFPGGDGYCRTSTGAPAKPCNPSEAGARGAGLEARKERGSPSSALPA